MINLICVDRDGTINEDDDYYLGSSANWKSQVRFLPGVIEGFRKLGSIPESKIFIVTNQSGVALKDETWATLTEERMHEVNRFIVQEIVDNGARIDGYFACPYVDEEYARKALARGRNVDRRYVIDNHPDLKPRTGMLEKAMKAIGETRENCRIYVMGDRLSDVQLGLNAGAKSILIPSKKTYDLRDVGLVTALALQNQGRVRIFPNFLKGVDYMARDIAGSV